MQEIWELIFTYVLPWVDEEFREWPLSGLEFSGN